MGGRSRCGKRTKSRKEDEEHARGDFRRRWKAKEIERKKMRKKKRERERKGEKETR